MPVGPGVSLATFADSGPVGRNCFWWGSFTMSSLGTMPIAVLAERTGVSVESIRSYEQLGLVAKPRRVPGGLYLYGSEEVERIIFIKRSSELGFPMEAIRDMLGLGRGKAMTCSEVYSIAQRQLEDIRRRQADLARMEQALLPLVECCPRQGGVATCPIVRSLSRSD